MSIHTTEKSPKCENRYWHFDYGKVTNLNECVCQLKIFKLASSASFIRKIYFLNRNETIIYTTYCGA